MSMRLDCLLQQFPWQLTHLGREAANGHDQPAPSSALMAREYAGLEQRIQTGRGTVYDVRRPDVLLKQSAELAISRRQDTKLRTLPALPSLHVGGNRIELLKYVLGVLAEAAVDDIDVPDCRAPKHQRQPYVPVRLQTGAEDSEGPDMVALL